MYRIAGRRTPSSRPDLAQYRKRKDLSRRANRAAVTVARVGRAMDCGAGDQFVDFAWASVQRRTRARSAIRNSPSRGHMDVLSWPKFARHIEDLQLVNTAVSAFETAADAIVAGDLATLERLLRDDPSVVHARSTREHRSTLLHYVAANGVENYRQKTPANIVQIAEAILKAGAEVDAVADMYGGNATTLGLAATSINPLKAGVQNALIDVLLDHGADIGPSGAGQSVSIVPDPRERSRRGAVHLAMRGAPLDLESASGVGRLDLVRPSSTRMGPHSACN